MSINTMILGVLGIMLCVMALLTSHRDPWLPYALLVSLSLVGTGWVWVRASHKRKFESSCH
ncbi:hypothetical protein [Agaribacter flavus]|uniref:Uncharacterized protein n=1 Tax=Agaribacter flavus TaxID=1902781 RepID=A0ABV7FSF4_9ALTE